MKKIDLKTLLSWRDQISRERMEWATARSMNQSGKVNQSHLDGYKAGLEQGMAELLNALELHGHVEVSR